MRILTVCGIVLLSGAAWAGYQKGQAPVGPQLYNIFGLGGYDPFGQLAAPIHVYSGPYFDEGPVRLASSYRKKRDTYSAPSSGYGAPSHGHAAPSSGYGAPSSGYGAPSHKAPSSSYGASVSSYGISSYGSYGGDYGGGYSQGGGKKKGGLLKRMRNMFKGVGDSLKKFSNDYNSVNSYGNHEQTYYAPSYVPVYYQTYDDHGGKKGGNRNVGKFFKNMGQRFGNNFKKGMNTLQGYGDSAVKGMKDFGYKTKNRFDKLSRNTVKKMKKMLRPYNPAPSYGPPKPSYGPPQSSYGPPQPSYGAPHGKHAGGHGGHDVHHGGHDIHHGGNDIHHGGNDIHHGGHDIHHGGNDIHHGGNDIHHGGLDGGHSSYASLH